MMKLHFSAVVGCLTIGQILVNLGLYVQFTRYIQKTSGVWTYFGQLGAICPNPKLKYFRQKIGQKNHFFYYYVQKAVDSTLFFLFSGQFLDILHTYVQEKQHSPCPKHNQMYNYFYRQNKKVSSTLQLPCPSIMRG